MHIITGKVLPTSDVTPSLPAVHTACDECYGGMFNVPCMYSTIMLMLKTTSNKDILWMYFHYLQLVLEHVLNLPPNLFTKLREMRDLPDITTELASPAYVFGMLV